MLPKIKVSYYKIIVLVGIISAFYITIVWHNKKSYYPVHTIESFVQATDILNQIDEHTLVLFDVDDVLITAPDVLARGSQYIPWSFRIRLVLSYPQLLLQSSIEHVYSLIADQAPRIVIEPIIKKIITDLHARNITVLGLTNMMTGSIGVIPDMPTWRYTMLKNMGILMSDNYPDMQFTTLKSYRKNYPVLYKGILCTNEQPKGELLYAFLTHFSAQFKHIILFDDLVHNLQSVGHACKKLDIPCTLFLYTGAQKVPGSWNTPRALQQVNHLMNEGRWVNSFELQ